MIKAPLLCAALLVVASGACRPTKTASTAADHTAKAGGDLLITGATIVTGASAGVIDDGAILVRDGRIAAVGPRSDIEPRAGDAERLDATGLTVTAGLVDAHGHLDGLGRSLAEVDLVGTRSYDEVIDRLATRAKELPPGAWVQGRGWDQNDWAVETFPTAAPLDAAIPDHPVLAVRVDGHAVLANTAAMKIAHVTSATPDPEGGRIIRDAHGNPTGVFVDNANALVEKSVPPPTREERKERIRHAAEYIASRGLTGMGDAGEPREVIDIVRELADEHALPIRVYLMLGDHPDLLATWFKKGPLLDYGGRLTIRAVKLYADGALGSRGAALLAPYDDDPGNTGLLVSTPEHLESVARAAKAAGFQVCTHAIGDRGNRIVIDAYEKAGAVPADRFRIEHFQVVSLDDFPRVAKLGLIASMQPTHATSDMPWAEARLGPERIKGAYAWRTVLGDGIPLALGSDFPVEKVNPMLGIYAAVTRQDLEGNPKGGWIPGQRLTPAEALAGFTKGAAFAAFEEKDLGTIEPGKLADLTILDANPLSADPADLWKIKPRYTIVGGEIVWKAE